MATLQWTHLCSYFVRGSDGRLSLVDLIDIIRAPRCPVVISVCVATSWAGVPNERFTFHCQIRTPEEKTFPFLQEIEVPFVINQPNVTEVRTTTTTAPCMVELKQFGIFSVDIVANDVVVYTLPFHFVPVPSA